jgi:hypothetical protein
MSEPLNPLERSLVAAATDPAARPQFYRDLASSDLFVIQEPDTPPQQLNIRPIEVNGHDCLPVFSSLGRLQRFIDREVGYAGMNALEFMKITRGAHLLLNPGSDYGKEFLPEEIASILDGSIWTPQQSYTTERETQVLLGQPARYPAELVDVLRRVFPKFGSVRAAYVAHFFNPAQDAKAHTLVAIDASERWDEIVAEAEGWRRTASPCPIRRSTSSDCRIPGSTRTSRRSSRSISDLPRRRLEGREIASEDSPT